MKKIKTSTKIYIISLFLLQITIGFAHTESKTPKNIKTKSDIVLTQEQKTALGLKTYTVSSQPISTSLKLNAQIQLLPNEQADVSSRINGQVTALYVNLGDAVTKGQILVKIQSRLVGNPPPSVELTAPMSGTIDERNVSLGQAIEPNMVLFHISNRNKILAVAAVYEEDLAKVYLNQTAEVEVLSYPKHKFQGKVILISPNLNPITRTLSIWVEINNNEFLLKPNMYGHVYLKSNNENNTLVVPNNAILDIEGEKSVFIVQGNIFIRKIIQTGISDDHFTEVKSGLNSNDQVVIQGQNQLYSLWKTGGNITIQHH